MKLSLVLVFFTLLTLKANISFGQRGIISLDVENATVSSILDEIETSSDFKFIYNVKHVDLERVISITAYNENIQAVLSKIFNSTNTSYVIKDTQIILHDKDELQSKFQGSNENITISGVVTDEEGNPLPGVTIFNEDRTIGVASDLDGKFSINLPDDAVSLSFSYIGFETQILSLPELTSYTDLSIEMVEAINTLDEIVVTGYQTLSKERTVGSFDKVQAPQLEQRPSSPNIIDRLEGQASGLNINPRTGGFEIRGRSTILGSGANPLIIVDGFPLADQLNFESINPEDVESITLLKDASASSIWGSRASNGVVVVITKKGGKNRPLSVNFSTFLEIEDKVDLDDFRWMTTSQEMDLDYEFIDKGWTNLNSVAAGLGSINDFHLALIYRNGLSPDGNIWSQNTFDNFMTELSSRNVNDEWEEYMLRNSVRTTYNLSLSGGGERNSFFGSLSFTDKLEQSMGESNDRITMNLRNVFDFNDRISFTAGVTTALRSESNNALLSQFGTASRGGNATYAMLAQPYDRLVDENGQYIQKYYNWNPWVSQEREDLIGAPHTYNYLEEQRNRDNSRNLVDMRADFKLDVEVLQGLRVSSSFRYEINTDNSDNFNNMTLPSHRNLVNDHYVLDANNRYINGIPVGSEYLQDYRYSKGWVFKNTLNYDKSWDDHDLSFFGGGEYNRRFSEYSINRQFGYDQQSTTYIPINVQNLLSRRIVNWAGSSYSRFFNSTSLFDINNNDYRFVSLFSNMGYTFKDKYNLNASFRIDQANIFGSNPDLRYQPLWSVGLGWDMAKESFMDGFNWLDRLKLRATYGIGGNSVFNQSPYPSARNRNINWGYEYVSLILSQPGNPDLKWEETKTTNLGVDFAVLKNRISGSLDYYLKRSEDLIVRTQLDPTNGFASANVNFGAVDNRGFELTLNAEIINTPDFNWSVRVNMNTNYNEVKKINLTNTPSADTYTFGSAILEGKPISPMYSYNFAGLDDNGEVLLYNKDGETQSWSDPVEIEDLVYEGRSVPSSYGGLSTTISYVGFDFTVMANYQGGFVYRDPYNYASVGQGTYNNDDYDFSNIRVHQIWDQRWRQPGDENSTNVPKVFYNGLNPTTGEVENRNNTSAMHRIWNQSTVNVYKGDYLRVQDIILGYTLPKKYLKPLHFNNLKLTMQVSNPFLFTRGGNDGVDPTVITGTPYLNLTSYTLGLRASF